MTVNFDLSYYAYKNCIFNIQLKNNFRKLVKSKIRSKLLIFY